MSNLFYREISFKCFIYIFLLMPRYIFSDDYYSDYYDVETPISVSLGFEVIKMSSPITFYILVFVIIVGLITIVCYIVRKLKPRYKKYTDDLHYDKVKNKIRDIIIEKQNQKEIEDELEKTENEIIDDVNNN